MKTFTDSASRTWTISMTIDSVKRVRDLLQINLLEPEAGDPPLLTRLGTDEILLCDVIYCLVKPQADQQNISDAQFGQALGGDAILAAQTAFYEEMIDFFLKRGRPDRAKAATAQLKMITLAVQRIEKTLDSLDLAKEIERIFGNLSGSLPESSASTQDP
jgi:hypothetical protein